MLLANYDSAKHYVHNLNMVALSSLKIRLLLKTSSRGSVPYHRFRVRPKTCIQHPKICPAHINCIEFAAFMPAHTDLESFPHQTLAGAG